MFSFRTIAILFSLCISLCVGAPSISYAESQALTVTPPLFQISLEPGSVWQSSVKVANSNEFPLTVYAHVVNFVAEGEDGRGKFVPVLGGDERQGTLAEWIEIPEGPYVIPEGQTADIQFFVEVPSDAAPGGHFAAILIETKPLEESGEVLAVSTSQAVASLFFTRVEGDVIEKADIREFSVLSHFVEIPEAEFSLRFENKGNVHVQPKGNIIITNMWGTERGLIPVNNKTHYGNVLPGTIRDFSFTWKGEPSITDIGRYKAEAVLAYGTDGVQSVTAITYFWVIPLKITLITLSILAAFIWFVTFVARAYIRHVLTLAGVDVDTVHMRETREERESEKRTRERDVKLTSYTVVTRPLRVGAHDLTTRLSGVSAFVDVLRTILSFIWQYKLFFASVLILVAAFIGGVLYINDASREGRAYEVTIDEGGNTTTITNDGLTE